MNAGHLINRQNDNKFKDKFPVLHKHEASSKKKSMRFFMEEVKEETVAWDQGFKLAKQLGIKLDKDDYLSYAARWVLSYMRHATEDKEWL